MDNMANKSTGNEPDLNESPEKLDNSNVSNPLQAQTGPRVNIQNFKVVPQPEIPESASLEDQLKDGVRDSSNG